MLRPRIIPCLLIHKGGLVKTQFFDNPKYVGDPINTVRIFSEKLVDELIVLDIDATVNKVEPNFNLILKLAAESKMPLCYGGGVTNVPQALRIIDLGVEKVAISAAAIANPLLLTNIAKIIGSQSVVAVIDLRKRPGAFATGYDVCTNNAKYIHKIDPLSLVRQLQDAGAGEIVVNSVDRDGQLLGYDLELADQIKSVLRVPLTFLGGAGSSEHLVKLFDRLGLVGASAGSLFVFKGKHRAVLINYPTPEQKKKIYRLAV